MTSAPIISRGEREKYFLDYEKIDRSIRQLGECGGASAIQRTFTLKIDWGEKHTFTGETRPFSILVITDLLTLAPYTEQQKYFLWPYSTN